MLYKRIFLVSLATWLVGCSGSSSIPVDTKLQTTKSVVQVSVPGLGSIDWTIRPDLDIDPLILPCPAGKTILVRFESDIDQVEFNVSGYDKVLFDIMLDGVPARTQIKCTMPFRHFEGGDYDADRSTHGQYDLDLKPILDTYIYKDEPGGILTIWDRGTLTYSASSGLGDFSTQTPRHVEDRFDIASVSKEFTTMLILKLIEEGKLSLDTTLSEFFPDAPNADKVSIFHLLTHTHGLPDFTDHPNYDVSSPLDQATAFATLKLMGSNFLPGAEFEYGNTSFRILAMIGEAITGRLHDVSIRTVLLDPAGLTQTCFFGDSDCAASRVTGYDTISGQVEERMKTFHPSHFVGAGDLISTFEDLQKWYRALAAGQIISLEMLEKAMGVKTLTDGTPIERGFGFFAGNYNGERVIYNSGDYYTHTRYIYFLDRDRLVALNTNNTIEHHDYVSSEIYLHVVGKLINRGKYEHWGEEIDLSDF